MTDDDTPKLTVGRLPRVQAGSCNACQTREADTVIQVSLNTLCFRVCDECATKLLSDLQRVLAPSMTTA